MSTSHQPETAHAALEEVRNIADGQVSKAGRLLIDRLRIEDYVGGGVEKEVFSLDDERVIAFFIGQRNRPEDIPRLMKSYYYSGKLAHLLMPQNFPDVHLAGSEPPVMVSSRIHTVGPTSSDERYVFRQKLDAIGMADAVDYHADNFLLDKNGNVVYVDVVTPEKLLTSEFNLHMSVLDNDVFAKARTLQSKILKNLVD